MMPGYERSLIFGSFIGIGALVVGVVSYRAMPTPSPRTLPVASSTLDDRLSSAPKPTDTASPATTAIPEVEVNTDIIAPATMPMRVTPTTVTKRGPENQIVAMLPPAAARRERQSKSAKQSAVKTAQLDVCAKIGKKRVYYNKGNGRYWRCR